MAFMRTEQYKNLPIPVVDLHGYQMIYHVLGVLWETSYIDAENKKEIFSSTAANIDRNVYQFQYLCNHFKVEKTSVFYFPCYVQFYSQPCPEVSIFPNFHSLNVCSSGGDTFLPNSRCLVTIPVREAFLSLGFDVNILFLSFQMYNIVAAVHKFN